MATEIVPDLDIEKIREKWKMGGKEALTEIEWTTLRDFDREEDKRQ